MGKLDGKVALITGAARGQGRAHAVKMAEEGANIIAVDICNDIGSVPYPLARTEDLEETARLVERAGARIVAREGDVRRRDDLQAVLDEGLAAFGHVDISVANAGIATFYDQKSDEPDEGWADSLDVMLTGVFNTFKVVVPAMVAQGTGGSIVCTGSSVALRPFATYETVTDPGSDGFAGYCAAKFGVIGLVRLYANGLGRHRIRVNSVHPGGVDTQMTTNAASAGWFADHPSLGQTLRNALPVRTFEPEEIAKAVLWLCSDDAAYVTGVALPVDAGFSNM